MDARTNEAELRPPEASPPAGMYAAHRARALRELEARGAAALVPTARAKLRNHDSEYRFRPDSDFWWLTGFDEPEAALVLLPPLGDRGARSVLFLRDREREKEVWTGRRLGVVAAPARLGVEEAYPIGELATRLPKLLAGYRRLCYRAGCDEERDREVLALLARLRAQSRAPLPPPQELVDPAAVLHELRLFKDEQELAAMRRAAAITAEAHLAAMRATRPGAREHEIEALIEYEFRRRGSTGPAYGTIVVGGANACVLHYVRNDAELAAGELLLVDAGAEWEYYASDVTRTHPVGGRFDPERRALYEVVLRAQRAALELARPGEAFDALHRRAVETLVEGLCGLGLLPEEPRRCLETESYKRFYMHRTSHWLGLDVHDAGAYVVGGASRKLEPGMVLTVEPGLYVAEDEESVEPRWRGIGVRIEDDVLITAGGHEVLTAAVPKEPDEVERACAWGT
jgi:Xaa-Pro aminopeptidase